MGGDVLDPLAVDVDLAAVAQALEIFRAGERPPLCPDRVFGFHPAVSSIFALPTASLLAYPRVCGQAILAGARLLGRPPKRRCHGARNPQNIATGSALNMKTHSL